MIRKQEPAQASGRNDPHWYAVYTRSRAEKLVHTILVQSGYVSYLPLLRTRSKRQDRRVLIDLPAFPGYVFVQCILTPERRAQIKRINSVVRLVETAGLPSVIPDEEIASVRLAVESRNEIEQKPYFVVGNQVQIVRGKMAGAIGELVRISDDELRLVISVTTVSMAIAVRVDVADVDLVVP